MSLSQRIASLRAAYQDGIVPAIFNFFMGRSTTFAIAFAVTGIIGWLRGKDLTSYALFVTALQGFIVTISVKEDWHEQRMAAIAAVGVPPKAPQTNALGNVQAPPVVEKTKD